MYNAPDVKIGIVAVSRDCFPESLSVNRRKALVEAYTKKYDAAEIYECPDLHRRERDPYGTGSWKTSRKQAVTHFAYILVTSDLKFQKPYWQNILTDLRCLLQQQRRSQADLMDGRGDAYCGMLNASYNLKLRNIKAYIPEYPVGTAEECADMIHEFIPIARTVDRTCMT